MPRTIIHADLSLPDGKIVLGAQPLLLGIVNVTPDSFSDGGRFFTQDAAVSHALQLASEGADWIDVGGESTRPGAEPVSVEEELRRVVPVIESLLRKPGPLISIDTYKPEVARAAVSLGAQVINDVTGFRDPHMLEVAASCEAACIVMHMRGTPLTMQSLAEYGDVVTELNDYFADRLDTLEKAGVRRDRVLLDPGIGFAKKYHHNLEILRRLDAFHIHGRPLLLGASRKRIIGELTGRADSQRLTGAVATVLASRRKGVQIFRVHDVAATRDALIVDAALDP